MPSPTVEQAISDFLESLRGKSPKTRETYTTALNHLVEYLRQKDMKAADTVTADLPENVLENFYLWLVENYGRDRRATVATHVAGVRSFLRYLYRHNVGPANTSFERLKDGLREVVGKSSYKTPRIDRGLPLIVVQVNSTPIPALTEDNRAHILNLLRDRAIINTLYCTGMRRKEVADLNCADVDGGYADRALITGKGEKERTVFFDEDTLRHIQEYLERRNDRYQPLFIRHDKRRGKPEAAGQNYRLAMQSIWLVVKKWADVAGVRATTHHFRHLKATTLLNRGADLSQVQDILGHASPETTKRIYAHYEVSHLRDAFDRFSVPASDLEKEMESEKRKRRRKEE